MMRLKLNKSLWPGLIRKQRKDSQRGIAAVEFALILPFLLVVLMGGMSVAALVYNQTVLTNASREAARWQIVVQNYSVSGSTYTSTANCPATVSTIDDPVDVACKRIQSGLISFGSSTAASVSVVSTTPLTGSRYVTVTVSYPFSGLISSLGFDGQLSPSTTMYYE